MIGPYTVVTPNLSEIFFCIFAPLQKSVCFFCILILKNNFSGSDRPWPHLAIQNVWKINTSPSKWPTVPHFGHPNLPKAKEKQHFPIQVAHKYESYKSPYRDRVFKWEKFLTHPLLPMLDLFRPFTLWGSRTPLIGWLVAIVKSSTDLVSIHFILRFSFLHKFRQNG